MMAVATPLRVIRGDSGELLYVVDAVGAIAETALDEVLSVETVTTLFSSSSFGKEEVGSKDEDTIIGNSWMGVTI
jgi:hypothetical protein